MVDTFTEHRLAVDYGEYLSVSLDEFRSNNSSWKEPPRTTVAERLEEEEHPMKKWEKSRKEKPKTPTLDDVRTAAAQASLYSAQICLRSRNTGNAIRNVTAGYERWLSKAAGDHSPNLSTETSSDYKSCTKGIPTHSKKCYSVSPLATRMVRGSLH